MFVFPAFNESYNKRKRTYKCCRKCRSRRVRCIIKDSNYEVTGCTNCSTSGIICDLIVDRERAQSEVENSNGSSLTFEDFSDKKHKSTADKTTNVDKDNNRHEFHNTIIKQEPESPTNNLGLAPDTGVSEVKASSGVPTVPPGYSYQQPIQQHPQGAIQAPIQNQVPNQALYQVPIHIIPNQPYPFTAPNPGGQPASAFPYGPAYRVPTDINRFYSMTHGNKPLNYGSPRNGSTSPASPAQPPPPTGNPINYIHQQRPHDQVATYPIIQGPVAYPGQNILQAPQTDLGTSPNCTSSANQYSTLSKETTLKNTSNIAEENEPEIITVEYLRDTYNFVTQTQAPSTVISIPTKKDQSKVLLTKKLTPQTGYIRDKSTYKYLKEIHAFTLHDPDFNISAKDTVELLKIYFREVNDVFMVVEESTFWSSYNDNAACSILLYAMILLTVRHQKAYPIISKIIGASDYRMKLETVTYNLERKIRQILLILPELGDDDKGYRCKVFCLLSLNFGPHKYGNEQSSQDLHAAIGLAMSILIHMDIVHQNLIANGKKTQSETYKKLWWTLYIIDRFNGVINTKAFMIKKEDFNIGKTDDVRFNGLVKAVEDLESVIYLIYQPQSTKSFEQIQKYITKTNQDIMEGSSQLKKTTDANIKFDYFKYAINNFSMIVLNNIRLRLQGKFHEFDNSHLSCCQNIIATVELAGSKQVLLQVPMIASIVSLGLSIVLKYRIKIIYLLKLNKLQSRHDLNGQKIDMINQLFDRYCYNLDKYFRGWWFINEILNSVEKLNNNTNNYKGKIHSKPPDKNKINIKSLLVKDESLPSVVSISSPAFYASGIIGSEFLQETEREMLSKGLQPNLSQLDKSEEAEHEDGTTITTIASAEREPETPKNGSHHAEQPQTSGAEDALNKESSKQANQLNVNKDLSDVQSQFSTPTTSVSDGVQTELLDVEGNGLLEYLNDELFNNRNLAEFVTEDPHLQDFFSSLE